MKIFINLFAGIGGFRIACASENIECVMTREIDEKARYVYAANFSGDFIKT